MVWEGEFFMADGRRCALKQQLGIEQILQDAQHRWLRPAEICEILRNYQKFEISAEPPYKPSSGSLYLFDRKVLRHFRNDGHNWRKKKDGKIVKEAHERLKAKGIDVLHCYYAHGEENESFQRHSYWMLEVAFMHIVLVHYLEVKIPSSNGISPSMASSSNVRGAGRATLIPSQDADILDRPIGSKDIGWDYGKLVKPGNYSGVQCKKCQKILNGGISRLKQHIAGVGEVSKCVMATNEEKRICRENLEASKKKKADKTTNYEVRQDVQLLEEREAEDSELFLIGPKKPRLLGPLDRMVDDGRLMQTMNNEAEIKSWKEIADERLSMWAYAAAIPFHKFSMPDFGLACEAIGRHGEGYKGPSEYQLRVPLLKQAYLKVNETIVKQKEIWDEYGCSILIDWWKNGMRRSVMSLFVHCKNGTSFIKSIEDSASVRTGEDIFKWVEECITQIGEHRVVQVVTNNAASNMAAKNKMELSRNTLFWSCCATHTIDLMVEDIGKLPKYRTVIDRARSLTIFLYAHHSTLTIMRKYTNRRELVLPGVTRFATNFLSLGCLLDKRSQLAAMVSSTEWEENKWAKTVAGAQTKATVYSEFFWRDAKELVKVYTPLFRLLRIVDTDRRPSMGFVYGMLEDAKVEIRTVCNMKESNFRPVIDIVEKHAKGRLDTPLHLTAYFLNPYYYYRDRTVKENRYVKPALLKCISLFFPEEEIQDKIGCEEFLIYENKEGLMGNGMAMRYYTSFNGTDNFDPAHWWNFYGEEAPYLRKMALKILNLTSSSPGCERNWSVFEGIHTKKRNILDQKSMNDLLFVQFNKKMAEKRETKKDVLIAPDDSRALHWKKEWVKERENEEEEIFSGSGLVWNHVAEARGANKNPNRRSLRTFRRRAIAVGTRKQESSYTISSVEVCRELSGEEDVYKEGRNDDYDAPLEEELVNDGVRYEDDDE